MEYIQHRAIWVEEFFAEQPHFFLTVHWLIKKLDLLRIERDCPTLICSATLANNVRQQMNQLTGQNEKLGCRFAGHIPVPEN